MVKLKGFSIIEIMSSFTILSIVLGLAFTSLLFIFKNDNSNKEEALQTIRKLHYTKYIHIDRNVEQLVDTLNYEIKITISANSKTIKNHKYVVTQNNKSILSYGFIEKN